MNDLTQANRDGIFEQVNINLIYLRYNGEKYPAKLYGRLLDFPVLRATNNELLTAEINWSLACRLASGVIDTVSIN
jgi:hypothetical protein